MPLGLEFPFQVLDNFFPSYAILKIEPLHPLLDGAIHPKFAALIDVPVYQPERLN
jgi:hypothetical protein